jgi:hypothetical protein
LNSNLDIFGSKEQIVHQPSIFEGIIFSLEEMMNIIKEGKGDTQETGSDNNELTQVQYSFINFDCMLKKMQIDRILGKIKNHEYLKFFENEE